MMKILFCFLCLIVSANINQFHRKKKKERGKVNTAVIVNICNISYRHGMPEFVIFKEYVFIVENSILQNWVTAWKLIWLLFHNVESILSLSTSNQERVTSSKAWYLYWNVLILLNCEDTLLLLHHLLGGNNVFQIAFCFHLGKTILIIVLN